MRYYKSETRIINNAIKMAEEVKKYHERTQSWDIPEHLIVDGCKVGKWWIEINKRIREGSIPDEVVHLMIDNKIDCGICPLYQEAWYLYFISYRDKESKWLGQFDKFSLIWRGKGMISADMRIGNKKVGDWAVAQIQDKDLSFWKEDMLDEIGFIWNERKVREIIRKRTNFLSDTVDSRRLQSYIDEADPAGITFIDVYGFVAENKGDIPWSGKGLFRCEVGINSIFTDKPFTDYVKKMQKEIAKRTKASFLRYAANSRIVLTDDDIRIHRMVASKSSHRIIILIRVTRDVEIEIEEAG